LKNTNLIKVPLSSTVASKQKEIANNISDVLNEGTCPSMTNYALSPNISITGLLYKMREKMKEENRIRQRKYIDCLLKGGRLTLTGSRNMYRQSLFLTRVRLF
jgi:hypothetical protein